MGASRGALREFCAARALTARLLIDPSDAQARIDEAVSNWHLARSWYEKAIPRLEHVTSRVSLSFPDLRLVNDANAGLARSKSEIEKLTASAG